MERPLRGGAVTAHCFCSGVNCSALSAGKRALSCARHGPAGKSEAATTMLHAAKTADVQDFVASSLAIALPFSLRVAAASHPQPHGEIACASRRR